MKNIKSVTDYLAFAQKTLSSPAQPAQPEPWQAGVGLRYRYAWEYESRWNTPLWAVGGIFLIGGVWPTLLNALIQAGLSKAPARKARPDQEYLNRFSGAPDEPKPAIKGVDGSEHRRLEELNAALASGLAPSGVTRTHSAAGENDTQTATPIRKLGETSDEPAQISQPVKEPEMSEEERKKRYAAGDFYPVARGPAKKG